jgi:hypothetical protein
MVTELKVVHTVEELHAKLIRTWEKVTGHEQQAKNYRIECGHLLNEMRKQVGDKWWEWFTANVRCVSHSEAERIMAWARAPKPEAAYQKAMDKQQEYNETSNIRWTPATIEETAERLGSWAAQSRRKYPDLPIQKDLIEKALNLVDRMNIPTKARFAKLFGRTF